MGRAVVTVRGKGREAVMQTQQSWLLMAAAAAARLGPLDGFGRQW